MTALTVSAGATAASAGAVAEVIASLPRSLTRVSGRADLVAVAGGPGWAARLTEAASGGARGAMVIDPDPAEAAPDVAIPVVVDDRHASNPALREVPPLLEEIPEALVEVRLTASAGSDPARLLPRAIALARAVSGTAVARGRVLLLGPAGIAVRGELADGRSVLLDVTATDAVAPCARVRAVGASRRVHVELPDPRTARPARVRSSGPAGSLLLPTRYETAHRASWRRLHDAVLSGTPVADLPGLASDRVALSRIVFPPAP